MIEVPDVAAKQAGAFTVDQALDHGWSARQVQRRLENGRWRRLPGGALVACDVEPSVETSVRAIRLAWPEAVACFRTAALLWDLPLEGGDGRLHVVAGRGRRAAGVRVHASVLGPREVWESDAGLARTSPRRTYADCLALSAFEEALDLYAWLSTRRLLSRAALLALVRERQGRPGVTQLRRLAALTSTGAVSAAEHLFHTLLLDAGITGWQANAKVVGRDGRAARVDVLFRAEGVAVEIEGRRAHGDLSVPAFVDERRRHNRVELSGLRVLRFTWWDLVDRPEETVAAVRRMLRIATT